MKGRILTDIPQTGYKAGDYADLDERTALTLVDVGAFDPHAPWPEVTPQTGGLAKPARKPRPVKHKGE
jgi:hypothetical protein